MRAKTVRSSRVLPPKNSQSPLVILGNKKKQQQSTPNGKTNAPTVLKSKAQPKLGRSSAPSGDKPLPKGKLKKAEVEKKAAAEDKKVMEPAKCKTKKLGSPPPAKKKPAAAKKEKAVPAKKASPPLRKVKAPKATPKAKKQPQVKEEKATRAKIDEPLLTKDGKVRKRAPYKKRVKPEPTSIELTDSAIAKILSKAKEPRGTKEKKAANAAKEEAKKPKAKPAAKADEGSKKTAAARAREAAAKAKEAAAEEKRLKSYAKLLNSVPVAAVKKEQPEIKPEPAAKKQPLGKAMNPPKKRAMAPLKKRLVARAAIDEAALLAQTTPSPDKVKVEKEPPPAAPTVASAAKKTGGNKKPATAANGKKRVDATSSAPSSPEAPKGKKRESKPPPKTIAQKMLPPKKRSLQALQPAKPAAKPTRKAAAAVESSSSGSSSEDEKPELDVFRFWAEPKKHRVASLNALAKVHCLYENEASRPAAESNHVSATTTTTTTRSISRTTKSSQWYDSSSESSTSGSDSNQGAMVPYRRGAKPARKTKKKPAKPRQQQEDDDDDDDDDDEEESAPSPPPKQTKRKKKKCDMLMDLKDMVVRKRMASLNASAMLAATYSFEKRTPSKNCTTTVEVVEVKQSTSIDKKADGDTVSTSSINMVRVRKNKILADDKKKQPKEAATKVRAASNKKRKKKDESTSDDAASADDPDDDIPLSNVIKLRSPKNVALIVNDTDVTITGVYVNSRSTEGYCISGMEYRISSTQTKSTTVVQPPSQVAASSPASDYVAQQHHHLHHHHHHHNPASATEPGVYHAAGGERGEPAATVFLKPAPPQSYTPLGALSSMQPPASLQQGPPPHHPPGPPPPTMGVHHPPPLGSSGSAFSAPISSCSGPPTHDQPHYLQGYYQPAGPLIHAGAEMCCVPPKNHSSSPAAAPLSAPNSAVSPLLIATSSSSGAVTSSASSTEVTSTSSTLPARIMSSQVSPFSTYQPQYAGPHYIAHYSAPAQYAPPPQYYHPQANHQLVAASHHLPPPPPPPHHEICAYNPCYAAPHYKYQPQVSSYHPRYAPPTQHYFPHTSSSIYSAPPPTASISNPTASMHPQGPMPSSSASKLPAPSTSAAPSAMYHPPPQHLPEPPHYHFYAGYSPGGPAGPCFPHPAARGVAFMESPYQTCPCPMQSCSKNVHAGPLTGDSKGPGPQESLFVLPTVAAAALPGESLAHPPSPARGSSGGPAAAQGTPPLAAADQHNGAEDDDEEQITPPTWVAAEPTPPPSDDSSAARASYFYDHADNGATDVNQNYNRKRKHALSSSTPLGGKKSKLLDTAPPPKTFDQINNNCTAVPPNLNEPLLITTTMLADASKVDMSKDLPLTPPTSSDTSPSISSKSSSAGKTEPADKAGKRSLKSPPEKEQFPVFSRSLDSSEIDTSSSSLATPPVAKKQKNESTPEQKPGAEQKSEKPEVGRKARKRSGQNTTFKKSKRSASASTLAAEKEADELAQSDLIRQRKSFTPKWSNGWSWEGEPYHAKVFLRSDDPPVLRNCYPAMRHTTGDIIQPRDCILLKSGTRKGDLPYVAKVTALWENPDDGEMMLSLLWFYRPEHTEQGRQPHHMADEIFASKHKDSSSVACIEDKCYVLTFNEYCRYRAKAKQIEVGALPRTSIVPQQSLESELAERSSRQPLSLAAPELVFFCQRVYDFRCKRMLKNPGA